MNPHPSQTEPSVLRGRVASEYLGQTVEHRIRDPALVRRARPWTIALRCGAGKLLEILKPNAGEQRRPQPISDLAPPNQLAVRSLGGMKNLDVRLQTGRHKAARDPVLELALRHPSGLRNVRRHPQLRHEFRHHVQQCPRFAAVMHSQPARRIRPFPYAYAPFRLQED